MSNKEFPELTVATLSTLVGTQLVAEPKGMGRVLLRQQATLHIEGQEKPALVAELLALYVARGSEG